MIYQVAMSLSPLHPPRFKYVFLEFNDSIYDEARQYVFVLN